jgi:hypothetical protein
MIVDDKKYRYVTSSGKLTQDKPKTNKKKQNLFSKEINKFFKEETKKR